MAKKTTLNTSNPKGVAHSVPTTPAVTETDLFRLALNNGWKITR